ncbi:hypothetical protein [Rosistilla oblonga]|uniref:hypothetical protein n=1 Tax=Rosistilla oblonga TaxID=2527990 RepID=UPI003A9747DE
MIQHENKIQRRQAIVLAAATCGSVGLRDASAGPRCSDDDNTTHIIRELHLQLFDFNQELVPRLVDGRRNTPTYDYRRAELFLRVSLYLRKKLDERSGKSHVAFDAALLQRRLKQLHVRSNLACSRFDDCMIRHPATRFLLDQQGKPGHAFVSLAWASLPTRLIESAEEISARLKLKRNGLEALDVARNASIKHLEVAFASMNHSDYLELVEALFMIRPETPVSLLQLHSLSLDNHAGYASVMSSICGNLMERLANNYFHQTIAISRLHQCNGSWHGFIAGQVFDILMQKWLWLMQHEQSQAPIETEETGVLSLAMQRGVAE